MTVGSAFAKAGIDLIDAGYSAIPIMPGEKRPGRYINGNWVGMTGWQKYCSKLPTKFEYDQWEQWPDAGVGIALGEKSGIVAGDFDYGSDAVRAAIEAVLPPSPVRKKGAKGYIAFYKYSGEKSKKWTVNGESVFELLSHGNQTVMPPSVHPDGMEYKYLTFDTLLDVSPDDLPALPENIHELITAALQPFMDEEDRKHNDRHINSSKPCPDQAQTIWDEVNTVALSNLDLWVPNLFPDAKRRSDGSYRVIAHWRGVDNPNFSIHPGGIRDWGGGTGHTCLDVVTLATSCDLDTALQCLRDWIGLEAEPNALDLMPDIVFPINSEADGTSNFLPSIVTASAVASPPVASSPIVPKSIYAPPGIAKEIADYLTGVGKMPQPIFSIAAALPLMATVLGNLFSTETGLRPNLMMIAVGPTSSGKDAARKGSKEITRQAGIIDRIGGEDMTSGSAIESALGKEPNSLFLLDEFGMMLKIINDPRSGGWQKEISTTIMKMFSSSGSIYIGKAYASQERTDIEHPCLSLYATTTGEKLDEALRSGDAASGFLNRFLFAETDTPVPDPQMPLSMIEVPQSILNWVDEVKALERPGEGNLSQTQFNAASTIVVTKSDEAASLVDEFEREVIVRRRMRNDEVEHSLWGRAVELVDKVALILAVGDDPHTQQIQLSHVEWSIEFVTWSISQMSRRIREFVADTKTETEIKNLLRIIRNAGSYTNDSRYGRACTMGIMPHSKLLKQSKLLKSEFSELISTMISAGYIEQIPLMKKSHGVGGMAYRAI
jgi:hypothetical protein